MALFGPQARLERCLWWAELTSWPHGASEERRGKCYDKVFGRQGNTPQAGRRLALQSAVQPKNDLLKIIAIGVGLFLVYKYLLKK